MLLREYAIEWWFIILISSRNDLDETHNSHYVTYIVSQQTHCCEQANNKQLCLLDTLLTVCVIHQLVVLYWRGVWEIFDVQVLAHDPNMSAIISLIITSILHALLCLVQAGANVLYRLQYSKIRRWALESFTLFIANLVCVPHWRDNVKMLLITKTSYKMFL